MLRSVSSRLWPSLAVLSLALASLVAPGSARAAGQAVSVLDGSFSPAALTITVGDTVTWTNADDSPHTVTADGGAFDSGNLDAGESFSFTFDQPGTYRYVCSYHDEMVGTITVVAATDAGDTAAVVAPSAAPSAAAPAAPAQSGTANHAAGHDDQPDTALPTPVVSLGWLPVLLIGLGLVAFAVALVPPGLVAEPSRRRPAGWRR